ncbi:MAG: coiled-coil domain-containing protein [Pseudomonadota bacterium]
MATTLPFDTLKLVERFQSVGFSIDQAKMMSTVLAELIAAQDASFTERFCTKQDVNAELLAIRSDIAHLGHELRSDIAAVRHEMKTMQAEMKTLNADTKSELIRWFVGVGLLQMGLIVGVMLKLAH